MHFYSSRKSWSFTEIAFIQSLSPVLSLSPTHPHIWCAIKSVKFYIFLLDITIIFRLNLGTAVKNDKMLAQTFFGLCLCPGHFTYTHISTVASVTRWLYYFFNIWPFTRLKFCLITLEICQSWLKIYQNTKLTLKMFPNNWIFFCPNGDISHNLVTLTVAHQLFWRYFAGVERIYFWNNHLSTLFR